jgi:hypothetical protein
VPGAISPIYIEILEPSNSKNFTLLPIISISSIALDLIDSLDSTSNQSSAGFGNILKLLLNY